MAAGREFPDEIGWALADQMNAYETGRSGGQPVGVTSTKVAWTLRDHSHPTRVKDGFTWNLNPQGIVRTHSSRNQLHGVRGGFYVDDFGLGATTIQVRQLVASGQMAHGIEQFTLREDFHRFFEDIYLPATTKAGDRPLVHFHDNHLRRGTDERVYFPPNALDVQRSVDLQQAWLVQITMISLQPAAEGAGEEISEPFANALAHSRWYIVKRGDTMQKITHRIAQGHLKKGKHVTSAQVKAVLATILLLNPTLKHKRTVVQSGRTITIKPHVVIPGDRIRVPR